MTAQTPIYGLKYLTVGEPARNTRAALQDNAETIEAALLAGGVAAPGAGDVLAVSARVTKLELDPVQYQDVGSAVTMTSGAAAVTLSPTRIVNPLNVFGVAGVGALVHVDYRALVNTATAGSGSYVDGWLNAGPVNVTTGVLSGATQRVQDSTWMVTRGSYKIADWFLVPAGTAMGFYITGAVASGVNASVVAGTTNSLWNRLRCTVLPYVG